MLGTSLELIIQRRMLQKLPHYMDNAEHLLDNIVIKQQSVFSQKRYSRKSFAITAINCHSVQFDYNVLDMVCHYTNAFESWISSSIFSIF